MADVDGYKAEIKRSFALVAPISTQAAAIFYPTLWEVDPSTKPLFKDTDMDKQGEKLMKTLGLAVMMLDKMDTLVPILQRLGKKHVSYGVKDEMYGSVGKALLITLDKGLGEECTPLTKESWAWVLGVISGVCIAAAKEEVEATASARKDVEVEEAPAAISEQEVEKAPATAAKEVVEEATPSKKGE
ncbi:unnamed protein product [Pylaiella littoralis]